MTRPLLAGSRKIVEALSLTLAAREPHGHERQRRTCACAVALARALGLDDATIDDVSVVALLHDIGMIVVPDDLQAAAGSLTEEELEQIRTHPRASVDLLAAADLPQSILDAIAAHHERWDGTGYPAGLRDSAIPLAARILATAETFVEIVLRQHVPIDHALLRLQHDAGRALDPHVVEVFIREHRTINAAINAAAASGSAACDRQARALEQVQRARREVDARYEIARAMSRSLALPDTIELLTRTLNHLVPLSSCALFVPGAEPGTLTCRFSTGLDAERIERLTMRDGQWIAGAASRSGPWRPLAQPEPIDGTGQDIPTVLASALIYPLIFEARFVGLLAVYHTEPNIYTREHGRLLGRICEQAAALIHHSLLYEQAREDSLRDPLTTLPNARYLYVHLERELARARRLNSPVSLMVLDLDAFKDINDTYGHQVGDGALRAVATALLSVIRPYDVCIRYAGDEFIVVLPNCGRDEAERKRLDLQRAVGHVSVNSALPRIVTLSISVGLSVFPDDGTSWEELIAAADRSMYQDKSSRKRHTASSPAERA